MNSGAGPVVLAMVAVWAYWTGVLAMAVRARLQGARSAGLVPEQLRERLMWMVWVPVIAAWILFPWFTVTRDATPWLLPQLAVEGLFWPGLRWLAALLAWSCFAATVYCWRWMGRNWRVGVTSEDPTELITNGPFSRVRHPIYSISILMIWCTLAAAPSWPLLVAAVLHTFLMNFKARNEETWMVQLHGQAYMDYLGRVRRFFPGG